MPPPRKMHPRKAKLNMDYANADDNEFEETDDNFDQVEGQE